MSTMNISLPDALRAFVEERVEEGSYGTSSEYIRELIRRDQGRQSLKRLLLEGLESPRIGSPDQGYWAAKRKRLKPSR